MVDVGGGGGGVGGAGWGQWHWLLVSELSWCDNKESLLTPLLRDPVAAVQIISLTYVSLVYV